MRTAALLCLTFGLSCRPSGQSAATAAGRAHVAVLRDVHGTVDVLRAGGVDFVRAHDGTDLFEDDRVRTFHGASAQLFFDGGSALRVDEESLISLGGGITIERGTVAGKLQAGLRLRTPTLEAESVPVARDIVFQ